MSAVEHELVEKISRLSAEQQRKVLEFVQGLEAAPQFKRYTPTELMHFPAEERSRMMKIAFDLAADQEFEIFEANSEEDFDDYTN